MAMGANWKILQSETLLRDRWIDLRADRCVTPQGAEITPYYVLSYPDWINVVAITSEDHLVLVRQYRHGAGRVCLELPSGGVEAGESPEMTARRELAEETGYVSERWQLLSSLSPNPASHANRVHSFLALDAQPFTHRQLDKGEEGLSVELCPVPQILGQLSTGGLDQAMHVSALLLALMKLGRLKA